MPSGGIIGYVKVRREPYAGPQMTPAERNVRPRVALNPQESPEGPRQGDIPSRPARVPIITFQAVAQILSVMQDSFGVPQWAPNHTASVTTLRGGIGGERMAPWSERVNIKRDPSMAYGSIFQMSQDEQYKLLMGA